MSFASQMEKRAWRGPVFFGELPAFRRRRLGVERAHLCLHQTVPYFLVAPHSREQRRHLFMSKGQPRLIAPLSVIFAFAGLLLFAYSVWYAGVEEVWQAIWRLGTGFLLVLTISAIRPTVRSLAWTRCVPGEKKLRFGDAVSAYVIGDALGNLVPFGIVVSEPTKAVLVRERLPLPQGLAAIAVENIFYSFSVMAFLLAGSLALLLSFPLPKPLRVSLWATAIIIIVLAATLAIVLRRRVRLISGAFEMLARRWKRLTPYHERIQTFEQRVLGFYDEHGERVWTIGALEAVYHVSSVLEAYVVLLFVSEIFPTPLKAFAFEAVNRITTVVFKFVPFRLGIDETGTGLLAAALGVGAASGVALAIVRKGRILCWTAVGIALLVLRGLSLRDVTAQGVEAARTKAAVEECD